MLDKMLGILESKEPAVETYRPVIPISQLSPPFVFNGNGRYPFSGRNGRKVQLDVQRGYGFDFTVRKRLWPLGPSGPPVRVRGEIKHDGYVHEITVEYPLDGDHWVSQFLYLFRTSIGLAERVSQEQVQERKAA